MKKGDHIYVDLGSFKQHGIYCGGEYVIYWINENSSKGTIRKSSLEEFSSGNKVKKRSYDHKCSSVNDVLKRAERWLDESKPKYSFLDSKAFAVYCKTGLKIGDHLYIDLGIYEHHGVYYDNDKVAHYDGNKIHITSLKRFSQKIKIRIVKHKSRYSSKRIIKRVELRIGEKKYNLIFNNCEHFATWCVTGQHRSWQVNDLPENVEKKVKKVQTKIKKKVKKVQTKIKKKVKKVQTKIKKKVKKARKGITNLISRRCFG